MGEKSNVIICLARDSTSVMRGKVPVSTNPSAVYISYDYGDTFVNITEKFRIGDDQYATLDKFTNHPKYNRFVSAYFINTLSCNFLFKFISFLILLLFC